MSMLLLLVLSACQTPSSDSDTGGKGDDSSGSGGGHDSPVDTGLTADNVPLTGTCSMETAWGEFNVDANSDYAYVSGTLSAGVVPATELTLVSTVGECSIYRKDNPYCDPGCEPGYTCDWDGTCIEYPVSQDLGTVDVYGLLSDVSMTPVTPGYTYFDTSVPNPPWTPGELVTLQTGGGAYDAVTLHGVAPDTLTGASLTWNLVGGTPLEVTWTAPSSTSRAYVHLNLQVDQHGVTPATVYCDFVDDGAGEVPAEAIDALIGMGVSGFPNGGLTRMTADQTTIGGTGCIDFTLTSSQLADVSVSGFIPCDDPGDCPDGETCNMVTGLCE